MVQRMIALALWMLAAPGDDARLARGDVVVTTEKVPGSEVPVAIARAVVDAPPDRVWAVVSDCARYKESMPNILSSTKVKQEGNVVFCRVVADLPFPFDDLTSLTRAVHTEEPGVRYERAWTLVEGDYRVQEGTWLVQPYADGKSLVTYRIHAEPRVALPQWILDAITKGKLPEVMQRVRKLSAAPFGGVKNRPLPLAPSPPGGEGERG
jgi:ribosome-associated toxin RatA of RatAB toxin-antitoxin module